jgi:hypothetical protein
MKTITVTSSDVEIEFYAAKEIADAAATTVLEDMTCLSWFDRERNQEAPAHVSECHDASCDTPGYLDYATSRGAELKVDIDNGAFVFLYRSVEEFTDII